MDRYMRLIEKYKERFNETFPNMALLGCTIEMQIEMLEECLRENKKIELEGEDDVDLFY